MRFLRKLVVREKSPSRSAAERLTQVPSAEGQIERTVAEADEHCTAARFAESIAIIDAALADAPDNIALLIARGSTLLAWGRHREALAVLSRVEALGPKSSSFHQKLGLAAFWTGATREAERCMRLALAADTDNWERHFGLGMVLHALRKNDEASVCFERALQIEPDEKHCLANLVSSNLEMGRLERAEKLARRAVELYPESAIAQSNLGVILDRDRRFDEALSFFDRAANLSAAGSEQADFLAHAICLLRAGYIGRGIALLESKLANEPRVQAHCHYSLALLAAGRMREGWEQYEFRWIDGPLRESRPNFVKPAWTGQDLRGKTILLRSEQGFGDFFQFIRYAPYVKALGATVHVQLHEAVREVARGASGVNHILEPDAPYPPFDYYVHLLTLPRIFDTDIDNVPADVPYLRPDLLRTAKWKERFCQRNGLKVGIAWAGSPTHMRDQFRSLRLEMLAPFQRLAGVTFYSLQKGPAAAEARDPEAKPVVVDLESELHDFADTAAAIHELDLVICVDTGVAHLAGALGKPVWAMIATPSDWRWLQEGEHTNWYPTMRLYRQTQPGDWTDVIDRIGRALEDVVRGTTLLPDLSGESPATSRDLQPVAVSPPDPRLTVASYTRHGFVQHLPDDIVGRSLRTYGEYLQPQLDLITRFIGPGDAVVEIGAGVGLHAVAIGKAIGSSGNLFLYEACRKVQDILRQNLASNGIVNATVMKHPPRGVEATQVGNDVSAAQSRIDGETIDALRLEKLSLLKINEGCSTVSVLEGVADTLWRLRPYVFASVNDDLGCASIAAHMGQFGYRSWRMQTRLFDARNFNEWKHDVFSGQSSTAVFAVPEEIEMDVALDRCIEIEQA